MKKFMLLLLFLPAFVFAVEEPVRSTPGITPQSIFYFLDRWSEGIKLFFTVNTERKAKLHLAFARERIAEIDIMPTEAQEAIRVAQKHLATHIAKARTIIESEASRGNDLQQIRMELDMLTKQLTPVALERPVFPETTLLRSQTEANASSSVTAPSFEETELKDLPMSPGARATPSPGRKEVHLLFLYPKGFSLSQNDLGLTNEIPTASQEEQSAIISLEEHAETQTRARTAQTASLTIQTKSSPPRRASDVTEEHPPQTIGDIIIRFLEQYFKSGVLPKDVSTRLLGNPSRTSIDALFDSFGPIVLVAVDAKKQKQWLPSAMALVNANSVAHESPDSTTTQRLIIVAFNQTDQSLKQITNVFCQLFHNGCRGPLGSPEALPESGSLIEFDTVEGTHQLKIVTPSGHVIVREIRGKGM